MIETLEMPENGEGGRMTIEETIKYCEEVAEEQDKLCKRYDDASGYSRSCNEAIRTTDAKRCEGCAKEHRQIADWLKELEQLREQTSALDKARAEIAAYGSIWVEYSISEYTEHGIEVIVKTVLKQAKEQVLKVIDKYKAESEVQDADSA